MYALRYIFMVWLPYKITLSLFFLIDQLVIPDKTQAESSSVYGHSYFPNNTVDGDPQQSIAHCAHTKNEKPITEAWLRINLLKVYSIKEIKFWYRDDGSYHFVSIVITNAYYSIKSTVVDFVVST